MTRLTISATHSVAGIGHYSRVLSISGHVSVAELCDSVLVAFQWPRRIVLGGSDCVEHWDLRISSEVFPHSSNPGAEAGEVFSFGSFGVLTVDGYVFVLSVGAVDDVPALPTAHSSNPSFGASSSPGAPWLVEEPEISAIDLFSGVSFNHTTPTSGDLDALVLTADFVPFLPDTVPTGVAFPGATAGGSAPGHPLGVPEECDIAEVNSLLAGEGAIDVVLAAVRPELRRLIETAQCYECVPMLQALDLHREADVSEQVAEILGDVPLETSQLGNIAAWARILALSALLGPAETDQLTEKMMKALSAALDQSDGDATLDAPKSKRAREAEILGAEAAASGLSVEQILALAPKTAKALAVAGADVRRSKKKARDGLVALVPRRTVVERLEMYRYLVQR